MKVAVKSPEATFDRIVTIGTTAAVLAFVMTAGRAIAERIADPYPELFVGIIGGVWWGIAGASFAIAATILGATMTACAITAVLRSRGE